MSGNPKIAEYGKKSQIKKGQTRNPNGRPRKLPELDRLLAEEISEEDWAKMVNVLKQKAMKCGNTTEFRALEMLFNRGWGMPKQKTEVESSGNVTIVWKDAKSS